MFAKLFSRRLWSRDFILIVFVCTIASYTNSTFMTLLPVYVLDLGGTNAMTGMMMTGLTVVGMFTRIVAAPLFDRVGRKKMLVLGAGLYAVNALLFCFTKDLNMLFALRVLQGFTQGVFFPVPHIIVADISPEDMLVDAMGLFGAANAVVFAVAPTIGLAIYNNFGPQALFVSSAATGFLSFLFSLFIQEHYHPAPHAQAEPGRKAKKPGFGRALLLLVLLPSLVHLFLYIGNSAVSNFLTPCGLSRGLEQISLYFLVNNIAVIVARLSVGRLIVYLSKKTCILLGVLLAAGGTALIAVAHNMPLMLLSAVLMGLGLTAATQLLQAQVMLTTPGEHRGVASTVFTFMGDIGTGAGAALWGALSAGAGYTVTYLLAGASTLVGCLFHGVYWAERKRTDS